MAENLPMDLGDPISQNDVMGGNGTSSPKNESTGSMTTETVSSSGVTPFLYFFIIWVVLLLLIVALIPLLVMRKRQTRQRSQLPTTEENAEDDNDNEIINENKRIESSSEFAILTILTTAAAMGLALSVFSILSCDFLELSEPITLDWIRIEDGDVIAVEFYALGLWAVGLSSDPGFLSGGGQQDTCFNISGFLTLGWQFKLARASAVLASLLGGLALPILLFGCVNTWGRSFLRLLSWPFFLATIFQLWTLMLLETEYCDSTVSEGQNCIVSIGAISSITASLYWLFCALAAPSAFLTRRASASL